MEQKSGLIGIYEKETQMMVWEDHPMEVEMNCSRLTMTALCPGLKTPDRMPVLAELGIKREVHGAISHPPDGNPLIGPAPWPETAGVAAAPRSALAGVRAEP